MRYSRAHCTCLQVRVHSHQQERCTGLNWEQGPKAAAVQIHRDYSFLPRDDIWFHIPSSSLTLSIFLCHLTNITALAHQSPSAPGRETDMDKRHEHSKWCVSLSTSRALCPPSLLSAKPCALYQAPCVWVRLVTPQLLPRTHLLSSFPASFPPFYHPVPSSPWRPVTFVSLSFRPFFWPWACGLACIMLLGRREKQLTCVPCKTPASALRLPQLHEAVLSCSVYTHNQPQPNTCKQQYQD